MFKKDKSKDDFSRLSGSQAKSKPNAYLSYPQAQKEEKTTSNERDRHGIQYSVMSCDKNGKLDGIPVAGHGSINYHSGGDYHYKKSKQSDGTYQTWTKFNDGAIYTSFQPSESTKKEYQKQGHKQNQPSSSSHRSNSKYDSQGNKPSSSVSDVRSSPNKDKKEVFSIS